MQASDFPRFRAVLAGMGELYGRDLSPALADAYWLALRDWSLPDFEQAAGHLMATAQFFPRPADFTALRKAGQETAAEAWARVVRQSPRWRCGEHGDEDPLIDACIRAIGGNKLIAMTGVDQLCWLEKRFTAAYEELRDATETRLALPDLTSSAEAKRLLASLQPAIKRIA